MAAKRCLTGVRVLVLVAAACSPPHAAAPIATGATYDAYVLEAIGLAAHARVDVVKATPRACPCAAPAEPPSNDELPCSCPAAIATWRNALDRCARPAALASVVADDRGHVIVPAIAGTTLVATSEHGETWIAAPNLQAPIALELAPPAKLRVTIAARAEGLHAAVVSGDGRCVPLHRDGDAWVPDGAVDGHDDSRVVVAANADGFALDALGSSETAELAIYAARAASGECPVGTSAHLDGAFQHVTARVDANGNYTFPHVLGFVADVTCVDATGAFTDEARYDPATGAIEGTITSISQPDDECVPFAVVDQSGRAVADANYSAIHMDGNFGTGTGGSTDAHGNGCATDYANQLTVNAPFVLGGQCAGQEQLSLTDDGAPHQPHMHLPITLHIDDLPRVVWRGRVVTPEGVPVANAGVSVDMIAPTATPDCYDRADGLYATTALDGTFALPALPHGKVTFDVDHRWYVKTHYETATTGPSRDIVVGRGATWTGRVLDPDGRAIDACDLFVRKPDQALEVVECARDGTFALSVLPPGVLDVDVRLSHHALGDVRNYTQKVTIAANEHRIADIRWPAGETIAGTVVDAHGMPVPKARVDALPKSVKKMFTDRFDMAEIVVVADAAGHFELHHIAPGTWVLKVEHRSIDVATGTLDARVTK